MDSFIYALVLTPALTELLPRSGFESTPANVDLAGSILFAPFLVDWGLSFIRGPLADRFGRTKVLAATIFTFAIFTGLAATSTNVWQLGIYRFIAGVEPACARPRLRSARRSGGSSARAPTFCSARRSCACIRAGCPLR
jgi:MFS family permease